MFVTTFLKTSFVSFQTQKHNKHLQEFVNDSDFWEAGNSFTSYGWLPDSGLSELADSEIDEGNQRHLTTFLFYIISF